MTLKSTASGELEGLAKTRLLGEAVGVDVGVGLGLLVGVGDGVGDFVGVGDGVAVGVGVGLGLLVGDGLGLAVGIGVGEVVMGSLIKTTCSVAVVIEVTVVHRGATYAWAFIPT